MNSISRSEQLVARSAAKDYPSRLYGWYVVAVLTLAYVFSFLDRQILSLLVEPMKRDLHFSDTQVSLLQGLAFAVFNALAGLPLGRLVDSVNRTRLVAAGIAFWSIVTAACGLTRSFGLLFLLRMGVGAGEAVLSPAANSMIGDQFPPHKIGLPLAVYTIGIFIGGGLALVIGATIIEQVGSVEEIMLPLFGPILPWQSVFLLVGLPGLLVAAWVLTLREPRRMGVLHQEAGADGVMRVAPLPLARVRAYLVHNWQAFLFLNLYLGFGAVMGYGVGAWVPTMFIRSHGWTSVEIGHAYGLIFVVFGTSGVICGGLLGDYVARNGDRSARLRLAGIVSLLTVPLAIAYPLVGNPRLALALLAGATFLPTFLNGMAPAIVQQMVPNQMRGVAVAGTLMVVNLLGLGLGPTLIALVTDFIFGDPAKLNLSIALVSAIMLAAGLLMLALALKPYRATVDRLDSWEYADHTVEPHLK